MQITVKVTDKKLHENHGSKCLSAVSRGPNSLIIYSVPGIDKIHISESPNSLTGGTIKRVF